MSSHPSAALGSLTPLSSAAKASGAARSSKRPLTAIERLADVSQFVGTGHRAKHEQEIQRTRDKLNGGNCGRKAIRSLRKLARATPDPIKRHVILLLERLLTLAHHALRELARECRAASGAGPPSHLPAEPVRVVMQLIDRIFKLSQSLMWKPPTF